MSLTMKSGIVTLFGRSNVGKSTLLNTLIGTKIAAVTAKPQTTRTNIYGILSNEQGQAVFVDTPGVLKGKRNIMAGKMLKKAREALQNIDLLVYVVDPSKSLAEEERYVLSLIRKMDMPKLMVINKSDLPEDKKTFLTDYKELAEEFDDCFFLSALKDKHIAPLREKIFELLPQGEPIYPLEQRTNLSKNEWIAEIIREKVFMILRQEVPYSAHVEVLDIEDKKEITVIKAVIYTSESHYKKMIIGHEGQTVKRIGLKARQELEIALNTKVYLELEIETDKHWHKRV